MCWSGHDAVAAIVGGDGCCATAGADGDGGDDNWPLNVDDVAVAVVVEIATYERHDAGQHRNLVDWLPWPWSVCL